MTGGQDAGGRADRARSSTRKLLAEGVARIIVTAEDPERYRGVAAAPRASTCWDRDRLDEAQRVLRDVPGVTVLIHDQGCAAEKRRQRKRGKHRRPADPASSSTRGSARAAATAARKTNCLSVQPVETEFGRKTRDPPDLLQHRLLAAWTATARRS